MLVHQQPHQLGNRQRWMGVVHLKRVLGREIGQILVPFQMAPRGVAHGAGHQEIFLKQTKLFAGMGVFRRVKNLGDRFGPVLFLDSTDVVALVEDIEPEALRCFRLPEAQRVHIVDPVADNRNVVRHALNHLPVDPHRLGSRHANIFELPVGEHWDSVFRTHDLPRVAELQPVVGPLGLPAICEILTEHPMLIAQTVSIPGIFKRGQ